MNTATESIYVTKETAREGDIVKTTYGCTMHRVRYYVILCISGQKVILGAVKSEIEGTSYDAGHHKVTGLLSEERPIQRAKFTRSGLKLCDDQWRAGDHYWDLVEKSFIGDSEYTYGD